MYTQRLCAIQGCSCILRSPRHAPHQRSGTERSISEALGRLNVLTSSDDAALRTEMAYGMFDTRGRVRVCVWERVAVHGIEYMSQPIGF